MLEDTQEQWRDINGFEGQYAVSSKGRVRNLENGKIFTGTDNGHGYRIITLKDKSYKVHRLVALAFIPNPDKLPEVDHLDEVKTNNNVSNLRWVTASENQRHSAHQKSCRINQLTLDGELVKAWDSFHQIERDTGYFKQAINQVCKGRLRQAYGYRWEYADKSQQRKHNRPVIAFKGTEYVGKFANAVKASEALGLKWGSVYKCLSGRIPSNKGYTFTYAE